MEVLKSTLSQIVPLDDGDWAALRPHIGEKQLPKKAFLLAAGDVCKQIYFIREGLLRLFYLKDGKEYIRQFFFEYGFCTDFASFITQQPSRLYIQAVEDCRLFTLPHYRVNELYESSAKYAKIGKLTAEQTLVHVSNRMASIFLDSPEEQYRQLLVERPKVMQRLPQYMIASYLGISPEALSRIRARL